MDAGGDAPLEGECAPRFRPVRDAFAAGFARHRELGACLAVVHEGELVVDLWGGFEDTARTRPWRRDTLANVFSVTKGVVSLCLALLVDRGKLVPEERVAAYWPEFAAEGKDRVTVAELLSHRAGLPAIRATQPADGHLDPVRMAEALAAERPWWRPGTRFGYHAITWGWLAGELLRRVDGRSTGRFVREELAEPLGLELHLGTPPELDARIAPIVVHHGVSARVLAYWAVTPRWIPMRLRVFTNPPQVDGGLDTRAWRAAEIPATNLHSNARNLARLYAAAMGGRDRAGLLRPEALARAARTEVEARDLVFGFRNRMGLGFMLDGGDLPLGSGGHAFGHTGAGGAIAFADPTRRLAFAYVPNRQQPTASLILPTALDLVRAIYTEV